MMHKAVFTFDDYPKAYIGYTNGRLWNGWETPHFELAEVLRIMADHNKETDNPIHYNEGIDTFYIAETEYTSGAIWEGEDCQTDEGIKHLYGIGAFFWIWEGTSEYYLAEVVEDFIYEFDTYGYRDVGIDRDEMVVSIKAQLKEPTVFQQVYEVWHNDSLTEDERFDKLSNLLTV